MLDYRAKLVEMMGLEGELLETANDPDRWEGSLVAAENLAWEFRNDHS